jgi:3-hydroxy-3-methylglutaryl CoA synthase
MSKIALLTRYIFFCLFFAIGAGSIALSFLAPELNDNYNSTDQFQLTEASNIKVQELIDVYDKQIEAAKNDPDMIKRLELKTFGTESNNENAAFPEPSDKFLQAATKALEETQDAEPAPSKFRKYIEQSADKKTRQGLFYSGSALILIAFICFAASKQKQEPEAQG